MKCPLCGLKLPDFYKQFTPHDVHFYHSSFRVYFMKLTGRFE